MTIATAAVTVANTATALASAPSTVGPRRSVLVHVPEGGVTVYVGGADVTTANGIPVASGSTLELGKLDGAERPYGIVASGTQAVRVLTTGG